VGGVVILGVFVADTAYQAERAPRMGETILGRSLALGPGGKGSNQAVAAARLGAEVSRITWLAAVVALCAPGSSEAQTEPRPADPICAELVAFEEQTNPTLPRPIDEATELVQVRVNCETQTVSYTKRLLVDLASLADGWQERKQRQYVQLHCNAQGLASVSGWNAMDVFFDREFNYLATFHATPQDCSQ
jgi:hypothetical protein